MAIKIDKAELAQRINNLEGLDNETKSQLLELLHERKRYGLVWEDKPEAAEERLQNELPILREVKERAIISDDPAAPNHILIEGDNLEALTTLSYTHEGKIDVIYIDPPYNTGNKDFVYNDSYVDTEDQFRHSKWLSFMAKRLKIAKRLLSDKGVIFISIDDNEQAQLKLLCDEVFGEDNFLCNNIWKSKSGGANDSSAFGVDHEYVLCYCKKVSTIVINLDKGAIATTSYNQTEPDGRRYALERLDKQNIRYSPSLDYSIIGPDGKEYSLKHRDPNKPNATWRWSKERVMSHMDELVFKGGNVYTKNYEKSDGQRPRSILYDDRFGRTRTGSTDLFVVLGEQKIFSYPKPLNLLNYLLSLASSPSATILDFFAGSGTTLHATMQLNAEDGGHRQCILVTNNENNICEEVTYERNKRVINGYTTPKGEQVEGLHGNTLRYFKTDFVARESSATAKRELMYAAADMLCIKNNIYTEQPIFGSRKFRKDVCRYFQDGERSMLVIYNPDAIETIVEELQKMQIETPILVYVFSLNDYAMDADFEDVSEKVSLCALPDAILRAYQRVLPKKQRKEDAL